jgi:hypothetical protein
MNQNTSYEMAETNTLENSCNSFFWQLTGKEKRLYKILSEITTETIIGLSIRHRLSIGSVRGFRDMINELNDQRIDAKKALIKSIGEEAVELIERISRS